MEKQLEYFDLLANAQKQAINSYVSLQNDLTSQWLDALGKTPEKLASLPGVPDTPQAKEAMNQFNTWFSTATSNTKAVVDAVANAQTLLINAYEKQVAVGRNTLKSAIEVGSAVAKAA
jgi:hypothetical protein